METVEELMAKVREQQDRVFEIQRAVERMEITAFAGNGEVSVKLKGNGRFTEVSIDPRALQRYDADSLGALVVEAVNAGLAKLAEATRKKFEPITAESRG